MTCTASEIWYVCEHVVLDQSTVVSRQVTPTQSRVPSPRTRRLSLNEQKTGTDSSNTQMYVKCVNGVIGN